MKIVLIGSGNLATHLGKAFQNGGHKIVQVYSRGLSNAKSLAKLLNCEATTKIEEINSSADIYFIALKDDAIEPFLKKFSQKGKVVIHTCGSLPMNVLRVASSEHGILYPLQSFNKARDLKLDNIPVFIESNDVKAKKALLALAKCISKNVFETTFQQRIALHTAAVFANNFTNHLYKIANDILKTSDMEFDVLKPLIEETASRVMNNEPSAVQTGPASRKDEKTIEKHLDFLKNFPSYQHIYQLLSESIERQSH